MDHFERHVRHRWSLPCCVIYYQHGLIAVSRMWAIIHPTSLPSLAHQTTSLRTLRMCLDVSPPLYGPVLGPGHGVLPSDPCGESVPVSVEYLSTVCLRGNRAADPLPAAYYCSNYGLFVVYFKKQFRNSNRESTIRPIATEAVRAARRNRSGLILLAIMSLCALASWAPINGAGFVITFILDYSPSDYMYEVFEAMVNIQMSADPVIFLLALGNLRNSVRRLPSRFKS
ncbi:hypothetical protein BV898_06452 [Hypsibius exemplaris]|uniref:G-protein coupled receptors family 1 profile domain-containing protein n=1 Tax=Hypsibius exemplaris TaxID=2072580 RepID=A0A1W0WW93_HYPEX|nr:hypothetical protein BV898_06452 [Hypsibius exemplaris]